MTFNIEKVDSFPEISRSGRVSDELNLIIEALNQSVKANDKFCIKGIEKGKAYNSMQQRIRAQAKKLGYSIVIRYDATEKGLYFKASANHSTNSTTELSVNANEMPSVKSKAKTSSTK
jgi:hypothetical protein